MAKKLQDGLDIYPAKKITSTKAQSAISRSEILNEIWAAKKHTIDGKWYVSLSDVCAILGEDYAKQKR
jgi:GH43 family beta-xylosidase